MRENKLKINFFLDNITIGKTSKNILVNKMKSRKRNERLSKNVQISALEFLINGLLSKMCQNNYRLDLICFFENKNRIKSCVLLV